MYIPKIQKVSRHSRPSPFLFKSSFRSLWPITSKKPNSDEAMTNLTKRPNSIWAHKKEFLKAVVANDKMTVTEIQRAGNNRPKPKIIFLASEDLIFVYNDVPSLEIRCRIAVITR